MMEMQFYVLSALALIGAGLVGGLLAGMLGVGGGIIIVPLLYRYSADWGLTRE